MKASQRILLVNFQARHKIIQSFGQLRDLRKSGSKIAFLTREGNVEALLICGQVSVPCGIDFSFLGFIPSVLIALWQVWKFRPKSVVWFKPERRSYAPHQAFKKPGQTHPILLFSTKAARPHWDAKRWAALAEELLLKHDDSIVCLYGPRSCRSLHKSIRSLVRVDLQSRLMDQSGKMSLFDLAHQLHRSGLVVTEDNEAWDLALWFETPVLLTTANPQEEEAVRKAA